METIRDLLRYAHNLAVWTHYTLVICGIVFVIQWGYDKYKEIYPAPQDQVAQVIVDRALKDWQSK